MFRTWALMKLTQISAWMGLIVVLGAMMLPRTFLVFIGIILLLNDDTWLQVKFSTLKSELAKRWKA